MQSISDNLGQLIRNKRDELSLTQTQFAELVNLSARLIIEFEKNEGNPKLDSLSRVIYNCKIDPNELFYPEAKQERPMRQRLRYEIADVTENEAAALIPVVKAVLSALREKDSIDMP